MPYIIDANSARDQAFKVAVRQETGRFGKDPMGRIVKLLLLLAAVGFVGLVGFAYLGDLSPVQQPVTKPVTLDGN